MSRNDEIRKLSSEGMSQTDIAEKFGVTPQRINRIIKGVNCTCAFCHISFHADSPKKYCRAECRALAKASATEKIS